MVPIIVVCYNNYKYVENTLQQILRINSDYFEYVQILDNCSNCEDTINYLKNVPCKVIYNSENKGPWISPEINRHIYDSLPENFILTDPDLEFHPNLPSNFIEVMVSLSEKYGCSKIGFALDISDFDKMFETSYNAGKTIYDWEKQFWDHKIHDPEYELYNADIDTTFCFINKNRFYNHINIRMAGNFTAKHLPWYKENKIYDPYENYITSKKSTTISTSKKMILDYYNSYF